jgi:glycosyltransferase involved in cell wall biosynthesis
MAVVSAGFVPVPAVDGGAGEVLTTEIINGNEISGYYYMDIYTIESPKLDGFKYKNAEIIQIHIGKFNWFFCKARNMFLKFFKRKFRFIPYNRKLLKVFRDNYDVILVENNMQVYEDIYKHAKSGTDNMIYHMHNDIDGTTKPEYLCRFIADTAKVILPVSEYIKSHFNKVAPNDKMKVLYNCIDFNIFDVNKKYNTSELREKYGINENEFVFLYTGRVCPEKGILELLKAFKKLCDEFDNIKLMIVGSRWYNLLDKDEYFKKLTEESKGYEEKIIFTGYVFPKDMPAIYTLGDTLVIPSMWEEPFGVVALEGMAMKTPIITTNSGGLVEVVDKSMAIIIDKGNDVIEGLEKAMRNLRNNKNKREVLTLNAYNKVKSTHAFNKDFYYNNFCKKIGEKNET